MPVSRRIEDRGATVRYAGRDWDVATRFPLGAATVLVVESEGGRLALVARGGEVHAVQPAAYAVAPLGDAAATFVSGTPEPREEWSEWR